MNQSLEFEVVFCFNPNYQYDQKTIETISSNRRALEQLFFDRLLQVLGVKESRSLYPPRTNALLRDLHNAIVTSSAQVHHKQALLYYILRDCRSKHPDVDKSFIQQQYLPERYRIFIDGIYYMDTFDFKKALLNLTVPSLLPTFPDEILKTLLLHNKPSEPLLPLAYYQSVSPPLEDPSVLPIFLAYLIEKTGVTSAFRFSQELGASRHHNLFKDLILYVHSPEMNGDTRAQWAMELINLPLNQEEEQWFDEILEDAVERGVKGAADTMLIRKITCRKAAGALNEMGDGLSRKIINGLGWEDLKLSLGRGLGPRKEAGEFWAQ
ncbi:MAG: hypothetical protein M1834_006440 [Cirrosporium novae-zelandiae]|nr:MAG: hypothetical protein M1834_006440 [Cirrosporium novae-zelandiae]